MAEGNNLVSRIGLIGSIASIAGLLGQLDVVPSLAVLATPVQLPAWIIAAAVGLATWLLPQAIGRAAENANRHLSNQLQQVGERSHDLESENQKLKGELKAFESSSRDLEKTRSRLHEAQRSLDAYESLEAEIMGLLWSGGEYDLLDIAQRTSAGGTSEGKLLVLRAISNLQEKIEGSGGLHKNYRLAPIPAAPADQKASLPGR